MEQGIECGQGLGFGFWKPLSMGPRSAHWQRVQEDVIWDVVVVGGGATGLGVALHASALGWKTLLLERDDYAKGTSSRSTKLIHGGVRYLEQGNIRLVKESLRERGLLMKNAPHLVHDMAFVIPTYSHWRRLYFTLGLKVYDRLAGRLGLGKSRMLSVTETHSALPNISSEGLTGGILYHDGQFDDALLAVALARTAAAEGATLVNHCSVVGWNKSQGRIASAELENHWTGEKHTVRAHQFVNATGAFVDELMHADASNHRPIIQPSQGVHVVVDGSFLPGSSAMLIPRTDDGRILFAVPWHGHTLLGTTDTEMKSTKREPVALEEEIDFIINHTSRYLVKPPKASDILSAFAGIRPLVKAQTNSTSALSRDHTIHLSRSGLLTIAGGKWTTYRKMAADVIKHISKNLPSPPKRIDTRMMRLVGISEAPWPAQASKLPSDELETWVRRAAEQTQCMTVEDFLARRTRDLFLDAREAMRIAPAVATILKTHHQTSNSWADDQVSAFQKLAREYLPHSFRAECPNSKPNT